jgi:aminopeptidase N
MSEPRPRKFVAALAAAALTVSGCAAKSADAPETLPSGGPSDSWESRTSPTTSTSAQTSTTSTGSASSNHAPSSTVVPVTPGTGPTGSVGIGDPYYPAAGNGGYQIDSYDLDLTYDPARNDLQSTALLKGSVTAAEGLRQFNLDLQQSMTVTAVTVNGTAATFQHGDAELVVTPARELGSQAALSVAVVYGGAPTTVRSVKGNAAGGWFRTDSGGAFAAGEPTGASAWYPVNEHPTDTAVFAVTATVPDSWEVISNGLPVTTGLPDPEPGQSISRWELSEPVASYLTTIYIDKFTLIEDSLSDGTPILSAIGPNATENQALAEQTKPVLDFLIDLLGPYPFESAGGIFTGESSGLDLETATRPIYGGTSEDNVYITVHELSHQWFGNDVTIDRWSDICINECLASYAPWLWREKVEGANLNRTWNRQMDRAVDDPDFWDSPLVDMGPGREFTAVYNRGPMAIHALRAEMGDAAFFSLLKEWPALYRGQNASFDDFEAAVAASAGRDLGPFIDAWFRGSTVPEVEYRYPGVLG